ncbi:MAG: CRISPR-associated protein Cas4 [Spirochaetia bacterium]
MAFSEDELIPISALQHLLYCERQFGLIHIDRVWAENRFTAEGNVLHRNAHQEDVRRRGDIRAEYAVPLRSLELGVTGVADVVEYLSGEPPRPVEFKRGRPKDDDLDRVQLCAQAVCLEEMTARSIPTGYLFYGKTRRRVMVEFGAPLRTETHEAARRARELVERGRTPLMGYEAGRCDPCSLFDICGPKIADRKQKASAYLSRQLARILEDSSS